MVERFLAELERELRRNANKALLPHFADVRADIQKSTKAITEKIDDSTEAITGGLKELRETVDQFAAEARDREQRSTQIDNSGEHINVAGKRVYDSTEKIEPAPDLPVIRCTLASLDAGQHTYRTLIADENNKELHQHDFTLKPDDVFLLEANHFLENDGLRDFREHLRLASDQTFTQRLGNHFYSLIMGDDGALRERLKGNGALAKGCKFVLELDTEAGLLWRVPWEFLRDSETFLGLSGKVHLLRRPKGAGTLAREAVPQPLKILVVVANPGDEGEFDSERALAAIQEATDLARRKGWVEIDYLEDATYENIQQRLGQFNPHVVHYIGHGGKNPQQGAALEPPFKGRAGETYLALQNEAGELAPLYGEDLKALLAQQPGLRLLVLSGCMTGQTAYSDALSGVGTALLNENLPALVVMQYSVLVDTAIQFAKVFYERVGRGEPLSRALTQVRQVLAQSRGNHRADWGIPALYLRAPGLQLVDPNAPRRVEDESHSKLVNIGDLPVVADFVGRTRELRQLRDAVRNPQQPVIYVWGLGGIGKTSVTAKLIEKLEQDRALDGRLVIRCDKIEPTFAAVTEKLGSFISLQGKAGYAEAGLALQDSRYDLDTRVGLLNNAIKAQRYLFVFDNFESLFSEKAPQVGALADKDLNKFFQALFSQNWRSTFLFTCRYRWDLLIEETGMRRFTCHLPLANCLLLHLPGLSPTQTRMLMRNLPELSRLTFNQQAEVMPLLQGHPHTIHLFNGYLKDYGLPAVLQDEKLHGKDKTAASLLFEDIGNYFLDGLWTKLNDDEKEVLGFLSVFRTALGEADLTKLVSNPQALHTLRNYSLLQRLPGEMAVSPISLGARYQVHPVVRGYVENKIAQDKLRACHLRAVDFYVEQHEEFLLNFLKTNNIANVTRNDYPQALAELAQMAAQQGQRQLAEHLTASLLEMHHHLFAAREYEHAGSLVTDLWLFLAMLGRRELAKALLRQSIASREGFGKYVALGNLATLLNDEGHWQQALDTYQQCIDYFEKASAKPQMAAVISQQALVYQERGDYEQALALERRALKIKEELKDDSAVIQHYRIAQLLLFMKRYDEALAAGEQALEKAKALGDQAKIAQCLHHLGLTQNKLDRPQEAFAKFQESLTIKEQIGDRAGQADSLLEMGKILMFNDQFDPANKLFHQAIQIYYEQQNPAKVAITLETIGYAFEQQGHFAEALEKYQEALRLARQYSSPQHIATVENHIARVQGKMG